MTSVPGSCESSKGAVRSDDKRPLLPRVGLLLLSTAIAVMTAEVALRVVAHQADVRVIRNWERFQEGDVTDASAQAALSRIIRPSENRELIYELRPNLSVEFLGQPVTTTAEGFRWTPPAPSDRSIVRRIVGVGDSIMFGWGVQDRETYLARLQTLLHEAQPTVAWQIVNTAVPGYNTAMEIETLRQKGIPFRPDLVIIDFVSNDLELPNFIREDEDRFALDRSYLVDLIAASLGRIEDQSPGPRLVNTPMTVDNRFQDDPAKVPRQYRNMVGHAAYANSMKDLAEFSRRFDFEVVVMGWWFPSEIHPIPRRLWNEQGFSVAPFVSCTTGKLEAQGVPEQDWYLSASDHHPSALLHDLAALCLFDYLQSTGALERLVADDAPTRPEKPEPAPEE